MSLSSPAQRIARIAFLAALVTGTALAQSDRRSAPLLTRADADARAQRLSDIAYSVELDIDGESPDFSGRVAMRFALDDARAPLTVDFVGGRVIDVVLNGAALEPDYNGYFLTLPAGALTAGENRLDIAFTHPYSTDGAGLYRFRDPEDGRYYLYTDFEPYDQNRLFPSFDQPNLKATFTTVVTAPADWTVISVTPEADVRDAGDLRIWTFPESEPISTYVYALHAGHYRAFSGQAGDIPLRLFVRESIADILRPDDWLMFTRQGFEFFEDYFGMPYPFGKYDQLIVPHFNAGAMENVGAVTFSERYLRRGSYTRRDLESIASVIMHEMAHMWFGNLVTMSWWNGLWLNESFATFMANLALVEATDFSEARESAYRSTVRAYRADERDTTHPIDLPIPDTDSAFANFDAITYNKGSATLTQLNRLVGPDAFRSAIRRYLATHAWDNTTLDDFLDAVSDAAERDLGSWAEEWLRTPGTNTLRVELECDDGRIESLVVVQGAPDRWPVLRTHRTQIGLYDFTLGGVDVRTLPVTYEGARTSVEPPAEDGCPDFVYPNHGDWDYARVALDPSQLDVLGEHIGRFDDPLTRSMLWQGVWDIAIDARMPLTRYIDFVLERLAGEPDDAVQRQVLGSLDAALDYIVRLDDEGLGARLGPRIEAFLWQQMRLAEPGSDRQVMLFDRFVAAATSPTAIDQLARILAGGVPPPAGLALDQDRRWNLLEKLGAHGHPDARARLQAERVRDQSDFGRLRALGVAAAAPGEPGKQQRLERLFAGDLPLADARAIANALFPVAQQATAGRLTESVLDGLESLSTTRDSQYVAAVAGGLIGTVCAESHLRRLDAALANAEWMPPTLERHLRDVRYESRRCLDIGAALADAN